MTTPRPMSCQELVELVTDYLEDALDPVERARFEAHLRTCEGCDTYVDQLRTTIALSGGLREEQLPGEVEQALLVAFRNWRDRG